MHHPGRRRRDAGARRVRRVVRRRARGRGPSRRGDDGDGRDDRAGAGDDRAETGAPAVRPSAAVAPDQLRGADLAEVGRRLRHRSRVRAEHDVPPLGDGLRRSAGAPRATIPDAVACRASAYRRYPGTPQGAPVEAAFSPDGRTAYVSNYSMYGAGFGPEGSDDVLAVVRLRPTATSTASTLDDAEDRRGLPGRARSRRYVAVTPDGRYVLVEQLVLVRPERDSTRRGQRGRAGCRSAPTRAGSQSSRRRRRRLRRGDGELATSCASISTTGRPGDRRRRRPRRAHVVIGPAGRYLFVTLNADGPGREGRPEDRRRSSTAPHRQRSRAPWTSRPTARRSTS